ncbi:hypothetical protein SK128_021395 [Halocaridina rubra]|uniref:Ig-like domain-containing protein n=1 Tax=Halocaridina rubra TaxID=373956 RepID=A0AAN9ACM0_HALRR
MFAWLWSRSKDKPRGEPPKFLVPLQPLQVKHGAKAVLETTVRGQPTPRVLWYHLDKEVVPSPDFVQEHDTATGQVKLTISEIFIDDKGLYRCVANNEYGRDETASYITVEDIEMLEKSELRQAPQITLPLQAQVVKIGSSLDLLARYEAFPPPTIKWYHQGKELKPSRDFIIEHIDDQTTLHVEEIFEDDCGEYEVRVFNEVGEARTLASIFVTKPLETIEMEPPIFVKQLQPQIVPEGEVAILEAEVTAKPEAHFQWYRHGQEITHDEELEVQITSENNKSTLVLGELFEDDSGDYTVAAQNPVGRASSTATLLVEGDGAEEAIPPSFNPPLTPIRVMDGEEVRFSCKVTGKPMPKLSWFQNGRPIGHHREVRLTQTPEGRAGLQILEVFPEDEGDYTCIARNKAGEARTTANLTVESYEYVPDSEVATVTSVSEKNVFSGTPSEEDETVEIERDSESDNSEAGSSPYFCNRLEQKIEVQEGTLVRLLAKANGYPRPAIKWYVDGTTVEVTEELTLENYEDGTVALTIHKTTLDDCGVYTCEAMNRNGIDTTVTTLVVLPEHTETTSKAYRKPEWVTRMEDLKEQMAGEHYPPKFTQEINNSRVKEMDTITFTATFRGNPKPDIAWYHNSKLIRQHASCQMRVRNDKAMLTLVHVTPEMKGEYSCRAANSEGEAFTKCQVEVIGLTFEEKMQIEDERYAAIHIQKAAEHMKEKERERSVKERQVHEDAMARMKEDKEERLKRRQQELEDAKKNVWKPPAVFEEKKKKEEKIYASPKERRVGEIYANWNAPVVLEENYPELEPNEFAPNQIPGVKCFVKVSETSMKGEEVVREVAPQFFEDEQIIHELAKIHTMLKNNVKVNDIWAMFRAGEFKALQQPNIQSALIKVCEYIGHQRNVSIVLAQETQQQALRHPVGLKAFLRMVKHAKNVKPDTLFKETIPKEMGKFSSTTQELTKVSELIRQGVQHEEIIASCEAGKLPTLKKPETQQPLVNIVEKHGHSVMVAQVLVEEAYRDAKDERVLAEQAWEVVHEEELTYAEVQQVKTDNEKSLAPKHLAASTQDDQSQISASRAQMETSDFPSQNGKRPPLTQANLAQENLSLHEQIRPLPVPTENKALTAHKENMGPIFEDQKLSVCSIENKTPLSHQKQLTCISEQEPNIHLLTHQPTSNFAPQHAIPCKDTKQPEILHSDFEDKQKQHTPSEKNQTLVPILTSLTVPAEQKSTIASAGAKSTHVTVEQKPIPTSDVQKTFDEAVPTPTSTSPEVRPEPTLEAPIDLKIKQQTPDEPKQKKAEVKLEIPIPKPVQGESKPSPIPDKSQPVIYTKEPKVISSTEETKLQLTKPNTVFVSELATEPITADVEHIPVSVVAISTPTATQTLSELSNVESVPKPVKAHTTTEPSKPKPDILKDTLVPAEPSLTTVFTETKPTPTPLPAETKPSSVPADTEPIFKKAEITPTARPAAAQFITTPETEAGKVTHIQKDLEEHEHELGASEKLLDIAGEPNEHIQHPKQNIDDIDTQITQYHETPKGQFETAEFDLHLDTKTIKLEPTPVPDQPEIAPAAPKQPQKPTQKPVQKPVLKPVKQQVTQKVSQEVTQQITHVSQLQPTTKFIEETTEHIAKPFKEEKITNATVIEKTISEGPQEKVSVQTTISKVKPQTVEQQREEIALIKSPDAAYQEAKTIEHTRVLQEVQVQQPQVLQKEQVVMQQTQVTQEVSNMQKENILQENANLTTTSDMLQKTIISQQPTLVQEEVITPHQPEVTQEVTTAVLKKKAQIGKEPEVIQQKAVSKQPVIIQKEKLIVQKPETTKEVTTTIITEKAMTMEEPDTMLKTIISKQPLIMKKEEELIIQQQPELVGDVRTTLITEEAQILQEPDVFIKSSVSKQPMVVQKERVSIQKPETVKEVTPTITTEQAQIIQEPESLRKIKPSKKPVVMQKERVTVQQPEVTGEMTTTVVKDKADFTKQPQVLQKTVINQQPTVVQSSQEITKIESDLQYIEQQLMQPVRDQHAIIHETNLIQPAEQQVVTVQHQQQIIKEQTEMQQQMVQQQKQIMQKAAATVTQQGLKISKQEQTVQAAHQKQMAQQIQQTQVTVQKQQIVQQTQQQQQQQQVVLTQETIQQEKPGTKPQAQLKVHKEHLMQETVPEHLSETLQLAPVPTPSLAEAQVEDDTAKYTAKKARVQTEIHRKPHMEEHKREIVTEQMAETLPLAPVPTPSMAEAQVEEGEPKHVAEKIQIQAAPVPVPSLAEARVEEEKPKHKAEKTQVQAAKALKLSKEQVKQETLQEQMVKTLHTVPVPKPSLAKAQVEEDKPKYTAETTQLHPVIPLKLSKEQVKQETQQEQMVETLHTAPVPKPSLAKAQVEEDKSKYTAETIQVQPVIPLKLSKEQVKQETLPEQMVETLHTAPVPKPSLAKTQVEEDKPKYTAETSQVQPVIPLKLSKEQVKQETLPEQMVETLHTGLSDFIRHNTCKEIQYI